MREHGLAPVELGRQLFAEVLLSAVLGSALIPPRLRWRLLRAAGLPVERSTWGPGCHLGGRAIGVGVGSYIGPRCFLDAGAPVVVGREVRLGHEVMLVTTTHEAGPRTRRAGALAAAPVTVGDGCWLGARVTVLPGVTVAAGCVVAAGAVVTADTAPDGLYAGVPARRVRDL